MSPKARDQREGAKWDGAGGPEQASPIRRGGEEVWMQG